MTNEELTAAAERLRRTIWINVPSRVIDAVRAVTDYVLATVAADEQRGVYVASRASIASRPQMWRGLRQQGWNITSTWIDEADEAGEGETADFGELWQRITSEIASSAGLVLFAMQEDFPLKGAIAEVGMALGMGKRVGLFLPGCILEPRSLRPLGSWAKHPLCRICNSLESARQWAELGIALNPSEPKSRSVLRREAAMRGEELPEFGSSDTSIIIDGERSTTVGDLQSSNHIGEIVYRPGIDGYSVSVNESLGVVDIEATLRANGYQWEKRGDEYVVKPSGPPPLQIQAGKFYENRLCETIGPMEPWKDSHGFYKWYCEDCSYSDDGHVLRTRCEHRADLIREVEPSGQEEGK